MPQPIITIIIIICIIRIITIIVIIIMFIIIIISSSSSRTNNRITIAKQHVLTSPLRRPRPQRCACRYCYVITATIID